MKQLIVALFVLYALPVSAQEALSPIQQYLYNESGYAPPMQQHVYPQPQPVYPEQQQVYAAPPHVYDVPQYAAPDGYYEDDSAEVGPSSQSPSLRAMMTSSGF